MLNGFRMSVGVSRVLGYLSHRPVHWKVEQCLFKWSPTERCGGTMVVKNLPQICPDLAISFCRLGSIGALRCLRPARMWERFRCRGSLELMSPEGLGKTISSFDLLTFRLASLRLTITVFFAMAWRYFCRLEAKIPCTIDSHLVISILFNSSCV